MKKHIVYCVPAGESFNWQKPNEIKSLPLRLGKYGRVKVTFEKYVPMKSLKQLGYYHAGILPFLEKHFFDETGMSKDEWHHVLKEKFGIKQQDKSGLFEAVKSHAKYTESEMAFFIKQVIGWAWDFFQVQIPPPTTIEEYL